MFRISKPPALEMPASRAKALFLALSTAFYTRCSSQSRQNQQILRVSDLMLQADEFRKPTDFITYRQKKLLGYWNNSTARSLWEAGAGFYSSPPRPDRLRGQPSPLSNGYRVQSSRSLKFITRLHLVPRLRLRGATRLHGVELWHRGYFTFYL